MNRVPQRFLKECEQLQGECTCSVRRGSVPPSMWGHRIRDDACWILEDDDYWELEQ